MLTQEQRDEFTRTGLVRIPGAVPEFDVAYMRARIWEHLHHTYGIHEDRTDTWTVERPAQLKALRRSEHFAKVGASAIPAALDDLMGAEQWQRPAVWQGGPLVTFPAADGDWDVPAGGWHFDKPFDRTETAEVPAINVFVFVAPVLSRGGGTVILTGSHRLVAHHAAASEAIVHSPELKTRLGAAHPWLHDLWDKASRHDRIRRFMDEGTEVDGIPLRVVELTGAPGDAYLMNSRTLHSVARNTRPTPRMMLGTFISR